MLAVERETDTLGGAGNVARNIASLGGRATLLAGRGNDAAGLRSAALLEKEASITDALLVRAEAATTEKLRYIAGRQQVLRADREASWPEGGEADALAAAEAALHPDDAINIQFTSGTTGLPKGATLTHRNILNNGYFTARTLHLGPDDRILPVPLIRGGELVDGLPSLGDARDRLRAALVSVPWEGLKLSHGEPAIPTVFEEAS